MDKIKIVFDKKYVSKDEIARLSLDDGYADVLEASLTPTTPQNSIFLNQILLIIKDISISVMANIITPKLVNLVNKIRKNAKNKRIFMIDSSGKREILKQSMKLIGNDDQEIDLIFETDNKLDDIQLNNIIEILNHLTKGRYYLFLKENGKIQIFTELEYAHYRHDNQENSKS